MKVLSVFAMMAALDATGAAAPGVNLNRQFRCVAVCAPGLQGQAAFVTQNGGNLNLLNEAGEPSRAWIDWNGHIWADNWQEGALFSADGMTIQFDRGTIWQRDLGEPPAAVPERLNRRLVKLTPDKIEPVKIDKSSKRVSVPPPSRPAPAAPMTAFDGDWSVVIMT